MFSTTETTEPNVFLKMFLWGYLSILHDLFYVCGFHWWWCRVSNNLVILKKKTIFCNKYVVRWLYFILLNSSWSYTNHASDVYHFFTPLSPWKVVWLKLMLAQSPVMAKLVNRECTHVWVYLLGIYLEKDRKTDTPPCSQIF